MYMQTVTGALHRDFTRDNYWTKVELVSDKSKRKTDILLCASYEYLIKNLKTEELNDKVVGNWVVTIIADIKKKGDSLFDAPTHFEVRAITDEGYQNGVSFLEEKVASSAI